MRILPNHPCIKTESHSPSHNASFPDDKRHGQSLRNGVLSMAAAGQARLFRASQIYFSIIDDLL